MTNARAKALGDVAASLGFKFEAEDWAFGGLASQIDIPMFERIGNDGTVSNVLTGERNGMEGKFFDYSVHVPSQFSSHEQTLAGFSTEIWLPQFVAAPLDIMHRISDAFSHQGIEFQSRAETSAKLWVCGPDEQRIRDLFNQQLVEFVMAHEAEMSWHFEGSGKTLILYRPEYLVKTEVYPQFIDEMTSTAKTFLSLCSTGRPATS